MLFERLPGETDEQWKAFVTFRDMGMSRTVTGLSQTLGVNRKTIQRYAKKHNWDVRIKAFDEWKISEAAKKQAEIIATDVLGKIDKNINGTVTLISLNLKYHIEQWKEYDLAIKQGKKAPKPQISSLRSIADSLSSLVGSLEKLKSLQGNEISENAAIDELVELLKYDAQIAETTG